MAIRRFMGLPRHSPVAASLAEAQTWPLFLLMLRQALHHVDRLHRALRGGALLRRLRSRPALRMGQICALYEELVPEAPCPIQPHHTSSLWTCIWSWTTSAKGEHWRAISTSQP
ncbi:hypothetical protein HPB52_010722 [Rhipicephalus sanguineus]|uniref:Uncharacterized protein n=1 Tax=Rhipicephalus sanguineus TaxID=34632 RepID=A0A9D4SYS6_RHISA|nr:hypothetical protein HPB52_010722 [Rhipicephalus sanguineus]